jgi:hypothetical protein
MATAVVIADLANPLDQQAILSLMDAYAADPMGDGRPLGQLWIRPDGLCVRSRRFTLHVQAAGRRDRATG